MDEMKESELNYMKIKDEEYSHIKIRARISNYLLLLFKIIEIFTLGSLAFTPSIDWELPIGVQDILNFFNTLSPSFNYGPYFVISVITVFVYLFVNYRSVIRIRHGEFGNCESNRRKRRIFSFDFLLVTFTNFISMVMGFFMLKIFFDAFSCDYSIKPQTMYQDQLQECFTGTHDTYFGMAIICLLIYLPEITYLWPNVQFQNRAQDIRYDPTHQTIGQSAKVLIACVSAFFAHPDDAVYFLGISAFILMMFGILTRKMKPCLVKIINPLEMGGYYAAGWMHISAIVCKYTNPTIGWVVMGCGFLIILLISLGYWKILHDLQIDNKRKKKIKQTDENGNEIEIEVDVNSDDEEDEAERRKKREKEESYEYKIWKKTKAFKDYKEDKQEWLDENLIPYKEDDEEILEDENQENNEENNNEIKSNNNDNQKDELLPIENKQQDNNTKQENQAENTDKKEESGKQQENSKEDTKKD